MTHHAFIPYTRRPSTCSPLFFGCYLSPAQFLFVSISCFQHRFISYSSAIMELPPRTQAPLPVVHNAYSPKEAIEISSRAGAHKATMRIDKIIVSSFMAGCLLSFGGACYTVINTSTWYNENAPGLVRMFGALIFPFGLVVIVMTGADLCTGSFMYTTLSTLHRRTSILLMLRHWLPNANRNCWRS